MSDRAVGDTYWAKVEQELLNDPRIQQAVAELQGIIRQRYPRAHFDVGYGDEPHGVYVTATVDIEDTDDVTDLYVKRLVELQVEDRLPVHVITVQPLERQLGRLAPGTSSQPA